jgi:hypothetical protein
MVVAMEKYDNDIGYGLGLTVNQSDNRAYDINLKIVRYEVARVEMEFVPGKKAQENQVEIVKQVWFGDVRKELTDGTMAQPVVIE